MDLSKTEVKLPVHTGTANKYWQNESSNDCLKTKKSKKGNHISVPVTTKDIPKNLTDLNYRVGYISNNIWRTFHLNQAER